MLYLPANTTSVTSGRINKKHAETNNVETDEAIICSQLPSNLEQEQDKTHLFDKESPIFGRKWCNIQRSGVESETFLAHFKFL